MNHHGHPRDKQSHLNSQPSQQLQGVDKDATNRAAGRGKRMVSRLGLQERKALPLLFTFSLVPLHVL